MKGSECGGVARQVSDKNVVCFYRSFAFLKCFQLRHCCLARCTYQASSLIVVDWSDQTER